MLSHEYETIIIIRPDIEESALGALADKFEGVLTEAGGHILDREDWGSRKLAYPIAKHLRGHYVRMSYLAPAEIIGELERRIRNEKESIVRFMTVRLADAVDVPTRIEEAAVQRQQREEEARRRAAELAEAEAERDDDDDDDDDDDSDD